MRENVAESRKTSGGLLRQCLVEGDEAAVARSRRMRRRSLLISLALQAALLAALVLLPLLATGSRLVYLRMTPVPPYPVSPRGNPDGRGGAARPPSKTHPVHPNTPIYPPPHVPGPVSTADRDWNESWLPDVGPDTGPPGIPGGTQVAPVDPRWTPKAPPTPPAVGPQAKPRPVVSEGVQQAMLAHRVEPVYPEFARRIHLEGTVQLHAIIRRDGAVRSLEVLSGHPILAQAAREAVSQWRYRPTLLNSKPVEVETYVTVIFQLQR